MSTSTSLLRLHESTFMKSLVKACLVLLLFHTNGYKANEVSNDSPDIFTPLRNESSVNQRIPAAVRVKLYYETMCPDSIDFIKKELWSTFKDLHPLGMMDISLYPYGNARQGT